MKRNDGPGEFMEIAWDGDPDYEVIRGHVPLDDALEAAVAFGYYRDSFNSITHTYGRWVPCQNGDYDMYFRLSKKSPGAFPVTILNYKQSE